MFYLNIIEINVVNEFGNCFFFKFEVYRSI